MQTVDSRSAATRCPTCHFEGLIEANRDPQRPWLLRLDDEPGAVPSNVRVGPRRLGDANRGRPCIVTAAASASSHPASVHHSSSVARGAAPRGRSAHAGGAIARRRSIAIKAKVEITATAVNPSTHQNVIPKAPACAEADLPARVRFC